MGGQNTQVVVVLDSGGSTCKLGLVGQDGAGGSSMRYVILYNVI